MPRKTYRIWRDGKDWDFTPGENGSYVSVQKETPRAFNFDPPDQPSKVISSSTAENNTFFAKSQQQKRRMGIIKSLSTRG